VAQNNFIAVSKSCSKEASQDMQATIKKIAHESGIPENHIVNAWQMLRDPSRKVPGIDKDNLHPNLKGNGEIAQEFFMKMSLSADYLTRQG
jgi:lysophospholipase L1-like esterase